MRRDVVSALVWLAVALFAIVVSLTLRLGSLHQPGPGFFPFWSGVILALLALVLLATAQRDSLAQALSGIPWPKMLIVVGAVLGYLLLLEPVGFGTVTFLFLVLMFRLTRKTWRFSTTAALAGALASHVLFQMWLRTQLPVGPLGF